MFGFLLVILLIGRSLSQNDEVNSKLIISDKLGFNVSDNRPTNSSVILSKTDIFLSTTESTSSSPNVDIVRGIDIETNNTLYKKPKGNDDFRPSPQIKETAFEKNIFPVKPAYPEAKNTVILSEEDRYRNPWERPDDTPWNVNLKFPETKVPTSRDRPYKFEESKSRTYGFSGKNDYDLATAHKTPINLGAKIPISSSGTGVGGSWEFGGYSYPNIPSSKYIPKKPSGYEYDHGGSYIEKPPTVGLEHYGGHEYPVKKKYDNPWKKIIKIIAAFIPIGLLISALTPTIITVSPMNTTMLRSRDDDSHSNTVKKLMSSLGYFNQINDKDCENRLLCELLLSASSSQNAQLHIENFLDNFSDSRKYTPEREEELKMIFDAVKKQRCENLICKGIRDNT